LAGLDSEKMLARLRKALRLGGNTHDVSDIVAAVKAGQMQAFSSEHALVVTQVASFPRARHLVVFIACGDLAEVMALQPEVEAFGRAHGCEAMIMTGRDGWSRILPEHGWAPSGVTYALPLLENAHG
jgi:hypothetical protein